MARTSESVAREQEHQDEIPRFQRQIRSVHAMRGGSFLIGVGAVVDDLSNGAITKALDKGILNHLDIHIGTGNLNATRLSVAGAYAVAGMVGLVRETRRHNHIDNLNLLAAQEAQADRIQTSIDLGSGHRAIADVILEPGEMLFTPDS